MTSILTSNQENIQSVRGELLSDSPHFATCLAEEGGRWEVDTGHQTDQYPPPSTLHPTPYTTGLSQFQIVDKHIWIVSVELRQILNIFSQ